MALGSGKPPKGALIERNAELSRHCVCGNYYVLVLHVDERLWPKILGIAAAAAAQAPLVSCSHGKSLKEGWGHPLFE